MWIIWQDLERVGVLSLLGFLFQTDYSCDKLALQWRCQVNPHGSIFLLNINACHSYVLSMVLLIAFGDETRRLQQLKYHQVVILFIILTFLVKKPRVIFAR